MVGPDASSLPDFPLTEERPISSQPFRMTYDVRDGVEFRGPAHADAPQGKVRCVRSTVKSAAGRGSGLASVGPKMRLNDEELRTYSELSLCITKTVSKKVTEA
jgi:hypothetical protein